MHIRGISSGGLQSCAGSVMDSGMYCFFFMFAMCRCTDPSYVTEGCDAGLLLDGCEIFDMLYVNVLGRIE